MTKTRILLATLSLGTVGILLGASGAWADDAQDAVQADHRAAMQQERAREGQPAAAVAENRADVLAMQEQREAADAQSAVITNELTGLIAALTNLSAEMSALVALTNLDAEDVHLVPVTKFDGLLDTDDAPAFNAALATPGVTSAAQTFLSGTSPAAVVINAKLVSRAIAASRVMGIVAHSTTGEVLVFFQ